MHREKVLLAHSYIHFVIGDDFDTAPAEGRRKPAADMPNWQAGVQVRPRGPKVKRG
jgi:hypothetical protein